MAPEKPATTSRVWRSFKRAVGLLVLAALVNVAVYAVLPPWGTPLMLVRTLEGDAPEAGRKWVTLDEISPALQRAVVASEDQLFCEHWGFDWEQVRRVLERDGRRGASTITMQTAKNVFLWPDRSYVRKALEVPYSLLIEALWSKEWTLEVYLNVAEWGRGIYGAEAAARAYFGRSAAQLSAQQAALMAAALPNPRDRSPARPSGYVARRASEIRAQMRILPVAGEFGLCP